MPWSPPRNTPASVSLVLATLSLPSMVRQLPKTCAHIGCAAERGSVEASPRPTWAVAGPGSQPALMLARSCAVGRLATLLLTFCIAVTLLPNDSPARSANTPAGAPSGRLSTREYSELEVGRLCTAFAAERWLPVTARSENSIGRVPPPEPEPEPPVLPVPPLSTGGITGSTGTDFRLTVSTTSFPW
ncbi:hypothetical protein D3C85_1128970 [compost metagenome]